MSDENRWTDKIDNEIGTLHMALLTEKVDEHILALVQFVKFGGDITQFTFCAYLIEKDRHQFGELLGQVINGFNRMVEQLGNVTLEKIGVLDTGTGELEVDD